MEQLRAYQFSRTAITEQPDILQGKTVKEFLLSKYDRGCIFGIDNLMDFSHYKIMGWCFDFSPYLKRYVVKQYDRWQEYSAPNKTMLRRVLSGRIQKIQEIK